MVGEKIKSARLASGITQQELADIVQISRIELSKIENNKAPQMRASTAVKIARALKVPTDFLFCDECLGNEPVNNED